MMIIHVLWDISAVGSTVVVGGDVSGGAVGGLDAALDVALASTEEDKVRILHRCSS